MSFVHDVVVLFSGKGRGLTSIADHWQRVPLGSIAEVVNGYPFPAEGFNPEKGTPVIRIRDVVPGKVGTFYDGTQTNAPSVSAGEIVVGMDGDFNCRPWPGPPALLNQRVCKVVSKESVYSNRFLSYVLPGYLKRVNDSTSAVTVKHLSSNTVKELPLPLPPRKEQDRLTSRLDELFSRIDDGERSLERARVLLERYRQSVLKAAVTGELTREWRERHRGEFESGKDLLGRILVARREVWEKENIETGRAKNRQSGKTAPSNRYQDPTAPETTDLLRLPEGWIWSSIGQLFRVSTGSTPSRKEASFWDGGIPWVSSGEVSFCRIKSTRETISKSGYENSSVRLHSAGTVLLAMIGEGRTRGQAAILDIDACNNQNAAAIDVSATPIPPEYVYRYLEHRYDNVRAIGQGGNQPALNADLVKRIALPLPPLKEIEEICQEIERHFGVLATLSAIVSAQPDSSTALRQSILHTAFTGRLVPQDPNDEPASVLLERIAAERAAAKPEPKPARAKRKPRK